MLMLSGILKQVNERNPDRKFNMTRRTNYVSIFEKHPAIAGIGYPPKNAKIVNVDYWSMDRLGSGDRRAYQVLARSFGLSVPVEEKLFFPDQIEEDKILFDFVPWGKINIAIAPASDSPRKMMPADLWHRLVDMLKFDGYFVFQVGRIKELHIKNAYSLLGLTTPAQAINLLKRSTLIITSDNFIMHAARLLEKPAIVLWGATLKEIYGYDNHFHITAPRKCDIPSDEECIDPQKNKNFTVYGKECPLQKEHCMALLDVNKIHSLANFVISH